MGSHTSSDYCLAQAPAGYLQVSVIVVCAAPRVGNAVYNQHEPKDLPRLTTPVPIVNDKNTIIHQ